MCVCGYKVQELWQFSHVSSIAITISVGSKDPKETQRNIQEFVG